MTPRLIGLIYLALEPYVRRRWASLIISWNRLLAGDLRDPMVGRDILIGGMLGLAHTATIFLMNLLPKWTGGRATAPNPGLEITTLQSSRHLLAEFIAFSTGELFISLCALLFLVLLFAIFRRQWVAIAAFWALEFSLLTMFFASDGDWTSWLGTALISTVTVICVARFGLLALISFFIFFHLSFHNAISANASSWYFGNTIFAAIVILGLAIYGFYLSLAGQKIFQSNLWSDNEFE